MKKNRPIILIIFLSLICFQSWSESGGAGNGGSPFGLKLALFKMHIEGVNYTRLHQPRPFESESDIKKYMEKDLKQNFIGYISKMKEHGFNREGMKELDDVINRYDWVQYAHSVKFRFQKNCVVLTDKPQNVFMRALGVKHSVDTGLSTSQGEPGDEICVSLESLLQENSTARDIDALFFHELARQQDIEGDDHRLAAKFYNGIFLVTYPDELTQPDKCYSRVEHKKLHEYHLSSKQNRFLTKAFAAASLNWTASEIVSLSYGVDPEVVAGIPKKGVKGQEANALWALLLISQLVTPLAEFSPEEVVEMLCGTTPINKSSNAGHSGQMTLSDLKCLSPFDLVTGKIYLKDNIAQRVALGGMLSRMEMSGFIFTSQKVPGWEPSDGVNGLLVEAVNQKRDFCWFGDGLSLLMSAK